MATPLTSINNSNDIVSSLIAEVGQLALWLQAIGVLVVLWIDYQINSLYIEKKKKKKLENIEQRINEIDKKLDILIRKP